MYRRLQLNAILRIEVVCVGRIMNVHLEVTGICIVLSGVWQNGRASLNMKKRLDCAETLQP
jgi:hypothetical protein